MAKKKFDTNPLDPDFPIGPPDLDKLVRAIGDAMKGAGVYTDDSRIVEWNVSKRWARAESDVGVIITVLEMQP